MRAHSVVQRAAMGGKTKKTRKFAMAKTMISPKDKHVAAEDGWRPQLEKNRSHLLISNKRCRLLVSHVCTLAATGTQ